MPAPENNQNAAKPEGERRTAKCDFRTYSARKGAYIAASRLSDMKLTAWIEKHLDRAAIKELKAANKDTIADSLKQVQKLDT